jgi:hypothetical protein
LSLKKNLLRKRKEEIGIISGSAMETFDGALNCSDKGMKIDSMWNIRNLTCSERLSKAASIC